MTNKQQSGRHPSDDGMLDYTIRNTDNLQSVDIQFIGHFNKKMIDWDANIITLAEYYRQLQQQNPSADKPVEVRQFIEISETEENPHPLRVALNVQEITRPVILKTIIMIHNYKRLRPGRHEYGPVVSFPPKNPEPACHDC